MTDIPRVHVTRVGDHRVTAVSVVGAPGTTAATDFATQTEVIDGARGDVAVSPSTLSGSRAYRDVRSFPNLVGDGIVNDAVALQAAFNSGLPIIIPKGVKVRVGSQLTIPSGLDLVIDGRIERTWGTGFQGGAGAMFNTGGAGVTSSNVRIRGHGSIGAPSLTVGGGQIFTGTFNDSSFEDIAVDTYWGGQAFLLIGNRIKMSRVQVRNSAVTAGTGGIRYLGGEDFTAVQCHIESGDDCLQFVPGETGAGPPIKRGTYVGCTGFSTNARFMAVISGGTSPTTIEDCSFVGCHGKASLRGILVNVRESATGSIRRISFRDCSVDCTNDVQTTATGACYIANDQITGTAVLEDITLDNVTIINPSRQALLMEKVNRASITNSNFKASRTAVATELLLTNCPDLRFQDNTTEGCGTLSAISLTGIAGSGPEPACNRALIADNQVLNVANGAYGIEVRIGTDVVVRRNRVKTSPTATTPTAAVRCGPAAVLPRIEYNQFTEFIGAAPLNIGFGCQAYCYENIGIPSVITTSVNFVVGNENDRCVIQQTAAGARTVTLQPDTQATLPIGEWVDFQNVGSGTLTVVGTAPVVLNGPSLIENGQSIRAVKTAANTYMLRQWAAGTSNTPVPSRINVANLGVTGSGVDERAALQAAFNSGVPLIIPKGMKVTVASQLDIPSNLDLVIDGRIERTWNGVGTGQAASMFRGGPIDAAAVRVTNVRISGTGSVGANSTTVGTGPIFFGGFDDSRWTGIAVDIWAGGPAFYISGHRLRLDHVRTKGCLTATGGGPGIRFVGGDDFVATACNVDASDDCLQFNPVDTTVVLPPRRGAYIGCSGRSYGARFMSVTSSGANNANIEDCSFIGCHGQGALRGISVLTTSTGSGAIRRVSFRDCSIDTISDTQSTLRGTIYVSHSATGIGSTVEDITFDNVSVINPSSLAVDFTRVVRAVVRDCTIGAQRLAFNDNVRFGDCPDLIFQGNTILGSGTSTAVALTSEAAGWEPCNRARVEDNQILGILDSAYGIELRTGSNQTVRRNRFRNGGATAVAGVRVVTGNVLPLIEHNDFTGFAATNLVSVAIGVQAYVNSNVGIPSVHTVTNANYVIGAIDDGRLIEMTSPTVVRTVTLQSDSQNSLPIGRWVEVVNIGTAAVTLAGQVGVTIRGTTTITAGSLAHIIKTAANTYYSDLGSGGGAGTGVNEVWVDNTAPTDSAVELWVDPDDPGVGGGGGGATVEDATTSVKGIVMLAGDLAGTADEPRVPALLTKSDVGHSHTSGPGSDATTTVKGIVQLAGHLAGTADAPTVPLLATKSDVGHSHTAGGDDGTRSLDSFAGATDDIKLDAAIAWQQSVTGKPAIRLAARRHDFNVPGRPLYSGLKLVGTPAGPRNMEIASGAHVPTRIYLGNGITSGTGSWWVGTGDLYDVYMADFGVQGSAGSSIQQFIDCPVGTGNMYACQFHALSFNFMRAVFGRKDRSCAITQVVFSGHWTANNLWDTQFTLGGSDCQLWVGGMINIGPSSSAAQTGTYADNDYQLIFSSLSKTDIGYIYLSALNGWRGIKVTGASSDLTFFGGTYEGYKPDEAQGPLAGRAPGTVIRLEGGSGSFHGPHIGQCMAVADVAEGGYVHITGGEWNFYSPFFMRGATAATVPCIYQTGGRVMALGVTRKQNETWANRPILETGAPSPGTPNNGTYSSYCPDLSMQVQ